MDEQNQTASHSSSQGKEQPTAETSPELKNTKERGRLVIFSIASGLFGVYLCLFCFWPVWFAGGVPNPLVFFMNLAQTSFIIALWLYSQKNKSRHGYIFLMISCCVFALTVLSPALHRVRQGGKPPLCQSNLKQLGLAINLYARDNKGYLPSAKKWCDLLSEHIIDDSTKEVFKCPSAREGDYGYAFNKKLDGLYLADVPGDVVLVFEADGGWNLTGGPELLSLRHEWDSSEDIYRRRCCNLLFVNGDVRRYRVDNLIRQPPRWEP
jgi:hypothetical protein